MRNNNNGYHFSTIIIILIMFVLVVSLKVAYNQGTESFGAKLENKSFADSSKVSSRYTHALQGSLIKNSQNKSSSNTRHAVLATSKNGSTLNMSSNNGAPTLMHVTINQNYWSLLPQFIVSGLAAGAALFLANIGLDRYRRPCLVVDKNDLLKLVVIDVNLYEIDLPNFSRELRYFKAQYIVNRVIIKNNGRSAALGCKGILKIKDMEEKICWYVPSERYKMTINPDSSEYLDVCAVLKDDTKEIYEQLQKRIEKFGDGKNGGAEARNIVLDLYKTHEDIPIIITPTENGWQPAKSNRRIGSGDATVIVNANNTIPYHLDIKILDKPIGDNGRLIELRD